MQNKSLKKQPLLFVSIMVIIFTIFIYLFVTLSPSIQGAQTETKSLTISLKSKKVAFKKAETTPSRAIDPKENTTNTLERIIIPTIKLNATLESVGLTSQGAAGTPTIPANAAWLNTGPLPGDVGNAIITGHFGHWKNGANGVFNNLNKVKPGDKIVVKYKNGVTVNFRVREIKSFNPNDEAAEVFISGSSKAHLNLITCEGTWDAVSKSYSKRLVIFTDKE